VDIFSWKLMLPWAIVLALVLLARTLSQPGSPAARGPESRLPQTGSYTSLPEEVVLTTGDTLSAVDSVSLYTLFLATSAGCPRCRRELHDHYPELVREASRAGIPVRVLMVPGSAAENRWFLSQASQGIPVVVDSQNIGTKGLGVSVVPSAVLVSTNGRVAGVFSPRTQWPVPVAQIMGGRSSREVPTKQEGST
jgi:hypothetical protein